MTFILENRGYNQFMAFLPGWAMEHEVFSELDLPYNYLLADNFNPWTVVSELKNAMDTHSIPLVDLFGFSMGGFCAFEIIKSDLLPVKNVIFAGIRNNYPPALIEEVKKYVLHNKNAYLSRFYSQCFFQRKNFIGHKDLFKAYIEKFSVSKLIQGLDYLASHSIQFNDLPEKKNIFLFHGAEDLIAPVGEMPVVFDPLKKTIISHAGHLFWLELSQKEWWKNL